MRLLALSAIALMTATAAHAQNDIFVHEPLGQEFTPPPIRIVAAGSTSAISNTTTANADAGCRDEVKDVYSYRARIYVACMRARLGRHGYRVVVMSNPNEVATLYGVSTR